MNKNEYIAIIYEYIKGLFLELDLKGAYCLEKTHARTFKDLAESLKAFPSILRFAYLLKQNENCMSIGSICLSVRFT